MDIDELDYVPITIEACLRGKLLFVIHVPAKKLSQLEVQSIFTKAIQQLSDPFVIQSISSDIIKIIEDSNN